MTRWQAIRDLGIGYSILAFWAAILAYLWRR